ncbi:flagellin [Exiguobacterium antarcticum]|uniref:Flagellin n=1 Tax=Exiguobacterium antarcticum TaxID=132920 RepID=A0ABT6QY92_9BACL|nr:flagellin [Exiguobacterium antarcticum]MDI3233593.1 flagellin [Exiguobacterium antarcticum]
MIINHNITALNTHNKLSSASAAQGKSMEKLASGLRINKAGDDAAGLAISEKMRGQVRGLDQASRNAQDGISLIQTAEGALNETHDILQRMRELSVQAGNDTNTTNDRGEIQKEISQLTSEVDRIADTTQFNTKVLLKGEFGTTATSANPTNLAVTSSKASTITEGTFAVSVSTAATRATYGSALAIDLTTPLTVDNTNDTLVLNGVNVKFNAGSTNDTSFISQINQYSSQTNVVASSDGGGGITLTDQRYGNRSITVGGNAENALFGAQTAVAGVDAVINTVGGTAVSVTADANDGRKLTINDGAFKGLQLQANATGAVNVTVDKASLDMQIGANQNQSLSVSIENMGAKSLGVDAIDVSTASSASSAITTIQTAIDSVSAERSKLGSYQNRLDHTINNLKTSSENLTAAESRVRDVDMAKEMMNQTKNSILAQAAQAMLAQSNQTPQGVLQLLR